ncbi:MAG: NAD(+) kinase [Gammaproteobacteria bacterium]
MNPLTINRAGVFQTIGLIGKLGDEQVFTELDRIVRFIEGKGRKLVTDIRTGQALGINAGEGAIPTVETSELGKHCDLVIVVGGDGTLLHAARYLSEKDVPLLGINRGRLGFLVDVSPEHIERELEEILAGELFEEQRFILSTEIIREEQVIDRSVAVNDVVIHRSDVARMIELDTFVDGAYVNTHRADGVIISTPTGSTAYALSSGGPLLYPDLEAITLVPICPHTLSNRPIVVTADSVIDVALTDPSEREGQVTMDGHKRHHLEGRDSVRIKRHPVPLRLIHPKHHDHFEILRAKLGWGGHAY